jgi:hypothetical protein
MPLPGLHDRPDQRFQRLTGQPHRAGTAADAAGGGRLILYAAGRRRAAAAGARSGDPAKLARGLLAERGVTVDHVTVCL